jgi:ubiquinone/menaquinone biosynthesis C-methylase UbiE
MKNNVDLFAQKSKSWDMKSRRVQNAKSIAEVIVKNINFRDTMEIVDFGAGTGLLSFFLAQKVAKVIAIDTSPSMLEVFKEKSVEFASQTECYQLDLTKEPFEKKVDGIVSSMTLHHIEDILALFKTFYAMLDEGGFIALADLDKENGDFHSDNTGVFHYGFDRDILKKMAKEAGFKEVRIKDASTISKPHGTFSVFALFAVK